MKTCRQRVTRLPRRGVRWLACLLAAAMSGSASSPAMAYQTYTARSGTRVVTLKWNRLPIRYFVTDRAAGGISADDLQGAASRAFATWQAVSTAKVSAEFAGFTAADPFDDDGMSTLGFLSRPDLDRVLGATDYLIDTTTGEIVESDIFFNSAFPWSVSSGGEPGKYDLESIALHEIGHLFGLGHSAIGETELRAGGGRRVIAAESVMFPIAFSAGNISGRTLRADDVAGLSDLYPSDTFSGVSGAVTGRVTKSGRGVYGAHVVAYDPRTGKLVGGFTVDSSGNFTIGALDPGAYILRVEPVDDADLDSFFDDPEAVDLDFAVTFFDRYVIVPHGGTSGTIVIPVAGKTAATSTLGASAVIDPEAARAQLVSFDPPAPVQAKAPRSWLAAFRAGALPVLGAVRAGLSLGRAAGGREVGQAAFQRAAGTAPQRAPARKPRQPGRPGSFEVSASALYLGSASLGSTTATLTPNQTGTADRYTYFQTNSQMQRSGGFEARLAYNLTRMFAVEGGMTYSRPGIGLTVSSDAEGAAGLSVTGETLSQYFFDVAGVVALRSSKPGQGRWTPFVEGGIGYLRQLHELKTLVETGQVFHGGGGVKYRLRSSPTSFVTGVGLRIDARFYYLNKGFSFDDKGRAFPAFGGGLEISF